jgi:hypothetical protein
MNNPNPRTARFQSLSAAALLVALLASMAGLFVFAAAERTERGLRQTAQENEQMAQDKEREARDEKAKAEASAAAETQDGKTLVSQSSDKTVKVWDVETATVLRTLQGNKAWVMAVAFSPDGKLFATGGIVRENDRRLACWRWQKGRSRRG